MGYDVHMRAHIVLLAKRINVPAAYRIGQVLAADEKTIEAISTVGISKLAGKVLLSEERCQLSCSYFA